MRRPRVITDKSDAPCNPHSPGLHSKGRDLRGGPRGGQAGGWRRLPKRLGAATVGYKCH